MDQENSLHSIWKQYMCSREWTLCRNRICEHDELR